MTCPQAGAATLHFSVWQLFDWVAEHPQLAEYVKRAVASLRARFLVAWRATDVPEARATEDEDEQDDLIQVACPSDALRRFSRKPAGNVRLPAG